MLKCFVVVLCVITIVFCAPGHENLREKQSTSEEQVTDQINGASRTKRQTFGTVDIIYLDAASIDPSKLKDLQSKEPAHLGPVNDVTNPGQWGNYQQLSQSNLELVTQNSDYTVYKLKSTGDSPLNGLPDDKKAQGSENQYYSYDSGQYSGYSGVRNPPPSPPSLDHGESQPLPPDQHPPPLPRHQHPPPSHYDGERPDHHPPPPPPDDNRSSYEYSGRNSYYDRPPPPPPPPDDDRSGELYDDRHTRQSSFDRLPPPHRGGPPSRGRGPPPRDGGRPLRYENHPPGFDGPPRHHGGPPDRYDRGPPPPRDGPPGRYDRGPPPHRGGPPQRYDNRPPPHRGGPPHRFENRPPPHPDRSDDRRPPPQDGQPDRFDNRPPPDRRPPPPPNDRRPPPDREQYYDKDNENNKNSQKENNSGKLIDATQTSSTAETDDDDQYQLDVRFNDDDQKAAEPTKRDVAVKNRPLPPYIFQAAPVTPED